jgi:hypothetical protein
MKRVLIFICFVGLFLTSGKLFCVAGEEFFQATFMSAKDAEKKWGVAKFDASKFKAASASQRAPMAVDAVKRRLYIGQDRKKVREDLGDPTGYFFSDTIYAYQIEEYSDDKKEAWQLVFIPDAELKKVADVKIHKKCCYQTPDWAK